VTDDSDAPAGYSKHDIDPNSRASVSILLPAPLRDLLKEERRERAAAAQEQRWAEELRLVAQKPPPPRSQVPQAPRTSALADLTDEAGTIKAFDASIGRRARRLLHPVIYGQEIVRVAKRALALRDKDYRKHELELLERIRAKGPLRRVVSPGSAHGRWERSLRFLNAAHPHFNEVTGYVSAQVALSLRSKQPFTVPPIHLYGPPGIGKTHYSNDLAEALGTPLRRQSMENAQSASLFLGSERHWSNAASGIVFDQIVLGDVANPILLIDELDKAPSAGRYDPLAALHSLLEPTSAKNARDAALDMTFDASLVIYVATSNNPDRVPRTIRSRLREFEISPPNGEQALDAARSIVASAIGKLGVPGFLEPPAQLAHQLGHLTAREITHAVRDAAARALMNGRLHLVLDDFPPETLELNRASQYLH
jgi:ATP-dependent Lon protease